MSSSSDPAFEPPPVTTGVRALSTVLHTLELLEVLAKSPSPLKLIEVVQRTGLSRATAYQRLFTLIEAGFLEFDGEQRYRISLYPARLATAALQQAGFGSRAEAEMTALMQATGETVSLAVLDQNRACIIARVETNMLLRAEQKIGSHMPLAGSASGRVLASFASAAEQAMLKETDEDFISKDVIAQVRLEGFAVSSGYSHSGVIGIAAPIFGPGGRCLAALSLVIPEQRYQLDRFLAPLTTAAARLSATFTGGKA